MEPKKKWGKNEFCFLNTKAGNFWAFNFCGIIIFRSPGTPLPLPHNITDAASDCVRILRNTQCVGSRGENGRGRLASLRSVKNHYCFSSFFSRMRKPKGNSGNGSRSPTRFFLEIQNCIWGTHIYFLDTDATLEIQNVRLYFLDQSFAF